MSRRNHAAMPKMAPFWSLVCLLLCPRGLASQTPASDAGAPPTPRSAPPPIAVAHVVVTPPVIDGRLTDPAWAEATPVTGFVQRELHEGAPITERTEGRIISDGQALYVGAWLHDSDPAGIVAGEKVPARGGAKNHYLRRRRPTYHDRHKGLAFYTTPAG